MTRTVGVWPDVRSGPTGIHACHKCPDMMLPSFVMQGSEKDSHFAKKMREVQRKQKSTTARAAKPSVEGRTITLMN